MSADETNARKRKFIKDIEASAKQYEIFREVDKLVVMVEICINHNMVDNHAFEQAEVAKAKEHLQECVRCVVDSMEKKSKPK